MVNMEPINEIIVNLDDKFIQMYDSDGKFLEEIKMNFVNIFNWEDFFVNFRNSGYKFTAWFKISKISKNMKQDFTFSSDDSINDAEVLDFLIRNKYQLSRIDVDFLAHMNMSDVTRSWAVSILIYIFAMYPLELESHNINLNVSVRKNSFYDKYTRVVDKSVLDGQDQSSVSDKSAPCVNDGLPTVPVLPPSVQARSVASDSASSINYPALLGAQAGETVSPTCPIMGQSDVDAMSTSKGIGSEAVNSVGMSKLSSGNSVGMSKLSSGNRLSVGSDDVFKNSPKASTSSEECVKSNTKTIKNRSSSCDAANPVDVYNLIKVESEKLHKNIRSLKADLESAACLEKLLNQNNTHVSESKLNKKRLDDIKHFNHNFEKMKKIVDDMDQRIKGDKIKEAESVIVPLVDAASKIFTQKWKK